VKCVICGERELENGQVCRRDELREADRLADIVRWHALLPAMLERGTGTSQRVSGSREAQLPFNVDAVDLSLDRPAFDLRPSWDPVQQRMRIYFEDQMGELAVVGVLDGWVRDWISFAWCPGDHLPLPTVAVLANWLTIRLPDAVRRHPAIDEYSAEIANLWFALRAAVKENPPKREMCTGVPCRRSECDQRALYRENDGSGDVRCGVCNYVLTAEEYTKWYRMNAAQAKEIAA